MAFELVFALTIPLALARELASVTQTSARPLSDVV
jgi:hypothetical protein